MVIRKLSISKLGPFLEPLTVSLHPRVTVLTGGNDVGKSSVLRALDFAFGKRVVTQNDINFDHVQNSTESWRKDQRVTVEVEVGIDQIADIPGLQRPKEGVSTMRKRLAPDVAGTTYSTRVSGIAGDAPFRAPTVIHPVLAGGIGDIIDLRQPELLESALLSAAFEAPFDFARLEAMNDLHFSRSIRKASSNLNRLLKRVLPAPGMIKFDLTPIAGDRTKLGTMIRDRHDGITPFGLRGEGVRKMVNLLTELLTTSIDDNHRLILLDEPENSLHADAQHLLREFLWQITEKPGVQVIYATHSPAMINPMRPDQVHLLVREKSGETANSILVKRPEDDNFAGVRTSLGVSIADSLLYAPVTVITEGDTEVSCLRPLIQKLADAQLPGFDDVKKLLGLVHFLDGNGTGYELLCRFAISHGTSVVVFLDGDKRKQVEQSGIKEKFPELGLVFTPESSEFEELVSADVYLQALADLSGEPYRDDWSVSLKTWMDTEPRRKRQAFSKRVEGWHRDTVDSAFPSKPKLMARAIELAKPDNLSAEPMRELLQSIRDALEGTSFD